MYGMLCLNRLFPLNRLRNVQCGEMPLFDMELHVRPSQRGETGWDGTPFPGIPYGRTGRKRLIPHGSMLELHWFRYGTVTRQAAVCMDSRVCINSAGWIGFVR